MRGPNMPNENNGLDLASKVIPDHAVPYSAWKQIKKDLGQNYHNPLVQELFISHAQQLGDEFWSN